MANDNEPIQDNHLSSAPNSTVNMSVTANHVNNPATDPIKEKAAASNSFVSYLPSRLPNCHIHPTVPSINPLVDLLIIAHPLTNAFTALPLALLLLNEQAEGSTAKKAEKKKKK